MSKKVKREITQGLIDEVQQIILDAANSGVIVRKLWLADQIIARHDIARDKEFYMRCAHESIGDAIRRALADLRDSPEERDAREQLLMPGYQRLQISYPLERDGETAIVPIDQCSNAELKDKAALYRKLGRGCDLHAEEIDRYRASR